MCLKNVNGFKRNRERVRDCFFLLGLLLLLAVDVDDVAVATEEEAREQGKARREEE